MLDRVAWVGAIVLGLVGGGFVFHFPGSYGEPAWNVGAGLFGFVLGAVNGLVVGALVWVALRLSREQGTLMLMSMVLIVGGTHALNDGSSTQAPFVLVQAVAGFLAAGTVAWILRERRWSVLAVAGSAWTAGLIAGGWSGAMLGLPLTETPLGWAQDHGWDGLVAGMVWATATALAGLPETLRSGAQAARSAPTPAPG